MDNSNEAFNIRFGYLHPATLEMAKNELRETPEVKSAAIMELRELLHESKDINYKDDDEFLLIFLRSCHFYPHSALMKMKAIAKFRKDYANLVHGLLLENIKEKFIHGNIVNVLKNCDQLGRRVMIIYSGGVWDPSFVPSEVTFQILYAAHITAQLEPESQVRGVVCIIDFDALSMKQIRSITPSFLRRLLTFVQDAFPLRLKEIHIVKQPFIFNMVWSLTKPFVKEKLYNRIHFHGNDMTSLHKYLDPEVLPEDYGGDLPKIDYSGKDWYPIVEKYEDFIREWSELGPAHW